MRWILLFLLSSCLARKLPDFKESPGPIFMGHELNDERRLLVRLKTENALSDIKRKLFLVKNPVKDSLLGAPNLSKPFALKLGSFQEVILVSKEALSSGVYGLYWQAGPKAMLFHTFNLPSAKMKHDLGKAPIKVSPKRTTFVLSFDGVVTLDDEAISVKSENEDLLTIENILVQEDKKTVELNLASNELMAGREYSINFGSSLKVGGESLNFSPIMFNVAETSYRDLPFMYSYSDKAVEFFGPKGRYELFFDDFKTYHVFDESLYLGGLSSQKTYKFWLRKQDEILWQVQGSFTTNEPESLHIAELKNDLVDGYIKVVLDEPMSFADLSISADNEKKCSLAQAGIKGKGEYFIVSSDYAKDKEQLIRLKDSCSIFKTRPKVIRVQRKDGSFVDRLGGFSWPQKKGILKRIDIKGLDEASNYCYQSLSRGNCEE